MTIPRKRKKLDAEVLPNIETENPELLSNEASLDSATNTEVRTENIPNPKKTTERKPRTRKQTPTEKVDKAFETVSNLKSDQPEIRHLEIVRKVYPKDKTGIHISLQIDPLKFEDTVFGGKSENEKNYIMLELNIPYPWNVQMVDEFIKNVLDGIKNFKII